MVAGEGEEESHAEIPIEGRVFDRETNRGTGELEERGVDMSEMILRVAQIISNNDEYCLCQKVPCTGEASHCSCCDVARAAFAAMREPTQAMCQRGCGSVDEMGEARDRWQAMIDEALR